MQQSLYDICRQYDIRLKKSLGQNLLLDDNINRIMVEAAELTPNTDVIEVGAGLGALTSRLCQQARRVLAVEIDRAFMPVLQDQFRQVENIRLFRGDILNHSLVKLTEEHLPGGNHFAMVSNLPYYITTPILFHFWGAPVFFSHLVVMVQEEVGTRMLAPVDSSDYGVLALAAQLHAEVDIVHRVPRTCFRPQPTVDSCIVRLRNRKIPLYPDLDMKFLSRVIRAAFAQRRKTLRNTMTRTGNFGAPKQAVLEAFDAARIDPERRPQTLTLDEFAALARQIRQRI